ncbi:hypothetical protein [Hymenobacter edaphi]|uniref:Uncharacterized protein n=1 Tax=Hymenobacter edaphi TaxID=2211146 RepID=A0A328BR57_9BACT|nr:hypothetical protein [Hymenobacter edaphi]RAK69722.1 hypothetical protein DLM85_02380 [Hymenobacter edaphi]
MVQWLDEDNITQLSGHYYTANYDDGVALHWYADENHPYGPPLLGRVYDTRLGRQFLVARASTDVYFLFPLSAATEAAATAGRLGPWTRAEVSQNLLRATGDTSLRAVGPF